LRNGHRLHEGGDIWDNVDVLHGLAKLLGVHVDVLMNMDGYGYGGLVH